jgi:hypothetical protein
MKASSILDVRLKTIQSSDYTSRSITTHGQMRRLLHQGARHSTVDHGDSSDGVFLLLRGCLGKASMSSTTCGCFLQEERSFSRMISFLFFLSSLWTASWANLSLSFCQWRRLPVLRVASSLGSRNGVEPTSKWAGPAQAHLSPVRSRLRTLGSS